jgi:superfamily I DNA/RNA helicase
MHFTDEQETILSSTGDIKINAVAGSGKTTTLIEYAKRQKRGCRILYLAFNRSVRMEALKRFGEHGLGNVDVQTAHSLAFRRIAGPLGYQISPGYKIHDIVGALGIAQLGRDVHSKYLIASHALKFASMFCNSAKSKVNELDYLAGISDKTARASVSRYYDHIEKATRLFLAMMDRKEIAATHDFYLKKFQLSRPALGYDVILFDEGQDASGVMLDVFLLQTAKKVIVGDVHQQIYGWRHAVNALKQVGFSNHTLSTSFRFNSHVADLAMQCLNWKRFLGEESAVVIKGVGKNAKISSRATIARTNLALLKSAIDMVQNDRSMKKIYFEGNFNSYTYASDGASVYDVLNLYLDKKDRVRDPLIASMASFDELEEYAEKSEDMELGMLIDIVEEYGPRIPVLLKKISERHVSDDQRGKADMIFSTLHRCKGMEYDSVTLAQDFITEDRVKKMLSSGAKDQFVDKNKISEEINLAYVAVTRSKNYLDFPDAMFPLADKALFSEKPVRSRKSAPDKWEKSWSILKKRSQSGNAYKPWSPEDDERLSALHGKGASVRKLSQLFDRKPGAIIARLNKIGAADTL